MPGFLRKKRVRAEAMNHAMYLRQQAELLVGLACATMDLGTARRLRVLAGEFRAKAEELEDSPGLPFAWPPAIRQTQSRP